LRDRRVKALSEKKSPGTFRLSPRITERLKELARQKGVSETAVIESLILGLES
jgi:predicted transcriptional regulator